MHVFPKHCAPMPPWVSYLFAGCCLLSGHYQYPPPLTQHHTWRHPFFPIPFTCKTRLVPPAICLFLPVTQLSMPDLLMAFNILKSLQSNIYVPVAFRPDRWLPKSLLLWRKLHAPSEPSDLLWHRFIQSSLIYTVTAWTLFNLTQNDSAIQSFGVTNYLTFKRQISLRFILFWFTFLIAKECFSFILIFRNACVTL